MIFLSLCVLFTATLLEVILDEPRATHQDLLCAVPARLVEREEREARNLEALPSFTTQVNPL